MAFCFRSRLSCFGAPFLHFYFTLRYFGHLPFVFLRRSVLFLLLCPRFVAFSLIFPLVLSFFQRNMSIFVSIRLFNGVKYGFFLLFLVCKSRIWDELQAKTPRQTVFFRRKMRFRARISRELKRKIPRKRWFLPPKRPKWTKKGGFGEEITGRR